MKLIDGLVRKLVVSLINTAVTIFIGYWNVMAIINAFQTPNADWNQVFTFLAISVVVLLIMWIISFLKFLRNMILLILILLLVGWFYLPQMLPGVTDGLCVTMGSCKEGVEVKTVSGKVVMNSQTCVKNGWVWNSKKNVCETKVKDK